jgi:hypothetical protein
MLLIMPMIVNGVRLDKLLAMEPESVIDAVPASERSNYKYWRGLNLGKIALNLMRGRLYINAGEADSTIHFINDHDIAYGYARSEASRRNPDSSSLTQWNPSDEQRFKEMTGILSPDYFAGAVIANRYVSVLPRSTHGAGHGYVINACVGFDSIDPHSREALEELFEMDLARDKRNTYPPKPVVHLPVSHEFTELINPATINRLIEPEKF